MHVLTEFLEHEVLPDGFWNSHDAEVNLQKPVVGSTSPEAILRRGEGMIAPDKGQLESALATWNAMREIMTVDAWIAY